MQSRDKSSFTKEAATNVRPLRRDRIDLFQTRHRGLLSRVRFRLFGDSEKCFRGVREARAFSIDQMKSSL